MLGRYYYNYEVLGYGWMVKINDKWSMNYILLVVYYYNSIFSIWVYYYVFLFIFNENIFLWYFVWIF